MWLQQNLLTWDRKYKNWRQSYQMISFTGAVYSFCAHDAFNPYYDNASLGIIPCSCILHNQVDSSSSKSWFVRFAATCGLIDSRPCNSCIFSCHNSLPAAWTINFYARIRRDARRSVGRYSKSDDIVHQVVNLLNQNQCKSVYVEMRLIFIYPLKICCMGWCLWRTNW